MTDGWSERRVGEFAMRKKVINEIGEDLPPLSVTKDHGVVLQSEKYNKRVAIDPRKYLVVEDGDFAFDPMSLYYGALGRVGRVGRGLISPDYVAFTADSTVDPTFLEYKLRSREMVRVYERVAQAGNQFGKRRRVYWSVLADLPVRLPPLHEQREIAVTLKVADDAVAAGDAVVRQVDAVRRELATTLFRVAPSGRRSGPLPRGWRESSVGAECSTTSGGTPSRAEPAYWNGPTPWVKTGEVNYSTIRSTEESLTDAGVRNSAAHLVPAGAVVIAMYGQGATRGRCALLGIDAALNQACLALIPFTLDAEYLFHYLWHIYPAVRELGHEGTQKNLNSSLVRAISIPVPPAEEQRQIAEALNAVMRRVEAEEAVVEERLRVRSALADALLSGRLRVREAA